MSPSASVTILNAGEGEPLEKSGGVFLVPAESIQRLCEHDVEPLGQRVTHQRLETGPKQRGTRDRMIRELLNDCPALASRKLPANPELVRDRCVALVVRRVPGVDGDLQCSVTSGGVSRSAATSRSNRSRAAWRARMQTRRRSRSSQRSWAMLRGAPCRACRRLRFLRDRIITPQLLAQIDVCVRPSTSAIAISGHHVIAERFGGPRTAGQSGIVMAALLSDGDAQRERTGRTRRARLGNSREVTARGLSQAAIRWKCAFTYMNAASRKNLTDARAQLSANDVACRVRQSVRSAVSPASRRLAG
jgi:hypothetical protein